MVFKEISMLECLEWPETGHLCKENGVTKYKFQKVNLILILFGNAQSYRFPTKICPGLF